MAWPLWLGLTLCLLAAAAVGLTAVGTRRWAGAAQGLWDSLEAGRIDDRRGGQRASRRAVVGAASSSA